MTNSSHNATVEHLRQEDDMARICRRMMRFTMASAALLCVAFLVLSYSAWRDPQFLVDLGATGALNIQGEVGGMARFSVASLMFLMGGLCVAALVFLARAFSELATAYGITYPAAQALAACGKLLLLGTLCAMLVQVPISALLTWSNPPGERTIAVSFGSVHLLSLVSGGAFLALAQVLKKASALDDELKMVI